MLITQAALTRAVVSTMNQRSALPVTMSSSSSSTEQTITRTQRDVASVGVGNVSIADVDWSRGSRFDTYALYAC
jgi:hypothetical protein